MFAIWNGCLLLADTYAIYRADSRFAPSQWETALPYNDVSHWLGSSLESARYIDTEEIRPKMLNYKKKNWVVMGKKI